MFPWFKQKAASGSRHPLLRRILLLGALAIVVAYGASWAISGNPETAPRQILGQSDDDGDGTFHVEDGRIVDPDGRRFVVKGVVAVHGAFAGGDEAGFGATNYATAVADLARIKGLGVNLLRLLITPRPGDTAQLDRLYGVVRAARQEGLVVEIGAAFTTFDISNELMGRLARRYRDDHYIWLQPMNEPNCPIEAPGPECGDWELWQDQHREAIRVIRSRGMESPIVINTPGYSASLARIDSHPLGDDNIVWGVHQYANARLSFGGPERTEERNDWADRTLHDRAIIVDEVGGQAYPEHPPYSPWLPGFIDFVVEWIKHRNGSGAVGFVWHWSDSNTMTDAAGALTPWGRLYLDQYLRRVPARL